MKKLKFLLILLSVTLLLASCDTNTYSCNVCGLVYNTQNAADNCANTQNCPGWANAHFQCSGCCNWYITQENANNCALTQNCPGWTNTHFQCSGCSNWYDAQENANNCALTQNCPGWASTHFQCSGCSNWYDAQENANNCALTQNCPGWTNTHFQCPGCNTWYDTQGAVNACSNTENCSGYSDLRYQCSGCGNWYNSQEAVDTCSNNQNCPGWANTHFQCSGCGNWYNSQDEVNNCSNTQDCSGWSNTHFQCSGCGNWYDTQDEANNCSNTESCSGWTSTHFQCSGCSNWYNTQAEAGNCSNTQNCPGYNNNVVNNSLSIKFNLSDAKALAAQENVSSGRYIVSARSAARATEAAEGLLVKILDDGSLASVIEFPEGYNPDNFTITQIAISPSDKSDELYIVVNNGNGQEGIGGLLCVKSDGSEYYDILTDLGNKIGNTNFNLYGNSSDNDYIKFDKLGNMYFQTQSWASNQTTTMIYKYNPKRNETTQLTPAVSGTYYEDYIVSDNGAWIFASATRWSNNSSTKYLRAIPTANAEQYVNITYSSSGNGWYDNLIYDDDNGYLYFNGYANNNSGLFRIQKKDGTFNSEDLKCMTTNNSSSNNNESFWFWNMAESKYTNIDLSCLLQWANTSEEKIVPAYKEFISVTSYYYENGSKNWKNKAFVIVDEENKLIPEELIKAYLAELRRCCDNNYSTFFTTVDEITEDDKEGENSPIQVDFRFDEFANIPGYELLATLTAGKKNEEAFAALDTTDAMCLLYKLLSRNDGTPYQYKERIGCYERNFLADITYLKGTDTLLAKSSDALEKGYFQTQLNGKYYSNDGCLQYIYAKDKTWVQKMNWDSDYMNGDTPNYDAILSKFFSYCDDGEKYFTLKAFKDDPDYGGLYTDKTDDEALQYITEADTIYLLQDWLWSGNDNKRTEFLKKTCLFKDTDEPACSLTGGNTYKWKDDFYNEDGTVNAEKILNKFYLACSSGEKEFNLKYFEDKTGYKDLYTDKIDEEAIEYISTSERIQLIYDYINSFYSSDDGNAALVKNTCFLKGTDQTAYQETNNSNSWTYWNYSDMKAMAKTSKGIFGSVPGQVYTNDVSKYFNTFMKLFDENGIFEMETVPDSDSYFATEIQVTGDLMVFKNAVLNSNGDETGSHTIQAFDASTSTFKDLFQKVDGSNIEITSYSVGGGYVYFSGVQGLVLISGKIDMETLEYTPIYSTKKMNQIITVTQ